MENSLIKRNNDRQKRDVEYNIDHQIQLKLHDVSKRLSTIDKHYEDPEIFNKLFDANFKEYSSIIQNSKIVDRSPVRTEELKGLVPPQIRRKPYFDLDKSVASVGDWSRYSRVSYALQYRKGDSYSKIGPWSKPLKFKDKLCPILGVPAASNNVSKLVYRKFDDEEPQLISILDKNTQRFRDVNRDIYNAASNPDEDEAMNELDVLLGIQGNTSTVFENGWKPIHAAAKNGNIKVAKTFLSNDYHSKDDFGNTPLHFAVASDYDGFVEVCKDDVNTKNHNGLTPLHIAAFRGYELTINKLVESGANITVQDNQGFTPFDHAILNGFFIASLFDEKSEKDWSRTLHFALITNDIDLIKKVIEKNKNINGSLNPLHLATIYGDLNTFQLLLDGSHFDINSKAAVIDWTPLHFAVALGRNDIVSYIVNNTTADINAYGAGDLTPLHLAVIVEGEDVAKTLLDKNASTEAKTTEGLTSLHLATKSGNKEIISLLVDRGADLEAKTSKGLTPIFLTDDIKLQEFLAEKIGTPYIFYAAQMGRLDVVKQYEGTINEGKINERDERGNTLLHYAVLGGHMNVVDYLCSKTGLGDDPNVDFVLPFHLAAMNGEFDIFKRVTDDFNQFMIGDWSLQEDIHGNTTMHYGVHNRNINVLKYIVEDTSDREGFINHLNKNFETPLDVAFDCVNVDAILYLASVEATGANGETALHLAAKYGRIDIVKLLLEKRVDNLNVTDTKGKTPLSYALENGNLDLAKLLIEKGSKDIGQGSLLHSAIKEGSLNMVKFLVQKKFDIEKRDEGGRTPLHDAVKHGRLDIVKYLVQKGAQVNSMDGEDKTPVHLAADEDNVDIIRYFAEHTNADMMAEDNQNRTPLQLATANNREKAVGYLMGISRQRRSLPFETFAITKKASVDDLPLISHSKSNLGSSHPSQIHDTFGTLLLFDVFIRKVTGRKYVCDAKPMPLAEAQACALNIAEEFEEIMKSSGSKDLDFYQIYNEIVSKVVGCKFDEISPLLTSYAKTSGVKSEEFERFRTKLGGRNQKKHDGNIRCWLKLKEN